MGDENNEGNEGGQNENQNNESSNSGGDGNEQKADKTNDTGARSKASESGEEGKKTDGEKSSEAGNEGAYNFSNYVSEIKDDEVKDYLSRFKDPEDLARNSMKLRQEIASRPKKPGDDASDKEVAQYRTAIGAGTEMKDYEVDHGEEVKLDDNMSGAVEMSRAVALKEGIPTSAYQEMEKQIIEAEVKAKEQLGKDVENFTKDMEKEYAKEYGQDWEKTLNKTLQLMDNLSDEGSNLKELANAPAVVNGVPIQLGSHPAFVKPMLKLAMRMGEGGTVNFNSKAEVQDANARIQQIRDEHYGKPSWKSAKVQNELQELYAKTAGTKRSA